MAYLGLTTLVVRDYDEAVAYYTRALGLEVREDKPREDGGRWVVVAPPGARETGLLLAEASDAAQSARVGDQTGGRVGFFLCTDDFDAAYKRMVAEGVVFEEEPRYEPYGAVVVFQDLYGNRWDLIQPA
jgi:catechol 2,3-dioxygenase-like lactoylglutathione lyase family enzyme